MARTTSRPRSGPDGSTEQRASTHHSLALKHVLRRFKAVGGTRILDLGPAVGRNVQYLGRFAPKIHIADLYNTLKLLRSRRSPDNSRFGRILDKDLPRADGRSFDLILAWDLLNYLDRPLVTQLSERLEKLCRRESLLFALIANQRQIPDTPIRFLIIDADTLRYESGSRKTRVAPQYKEPDLDRLMPSFEVETSYLLRNGMQEYVLSSRTLNPYPG
ncbi:MAG: hypothetical protein P8Y44_05315 [Acidobacteriota bacterium]